MCRTIRWWRMPLKFRRHSDIVGVGLPIKLLFHRRWAITCRLTLIILSINLPYIFVNNSDTFAFLRCSTWQSQTRQVPLRAPGKPIYRWIVFFRFCFASDLHPWQHVKSFDWWNFAQWMKNSSTACAALGKPQSKDKVTHCVQFKQFAESKIFSLWILEIAWLIVYLFSRRKISTVGAREIWKKMYRSVHPPQHKGECYCRKSICVCFEIDDDKSRENATASAPLRCSFVPTDVDSETSIAFASESDDDDTVNDSECNYSRNGIQHQNRW